MKDHSESIGSSGDASADLGTEALEGYFHLSLDLLCIADLNGKFLLVNPEWERVLGYSTDELNGRSFLEFVHPEDMQATLDAMKDLSEGREVKNLENRYRAKDGGYRWIQWRSKPSGDIIYAAARDITEHKKAFAKLQAEEAKLRGLFDLADVGIVMNDAETGAFVLFNDKLLEPTGYTREEFLRLTFWQVTPEEYAEQEHCQLTQLRELGKYGPYEKEYIRKDGSRYPVRLSGFLMKDGDGRDVIWSIVQDVSEERETERVLRETAFKAQEANRAKSAFLATMSHEIRTPLNGVIGGTELLRTTRLSAEQESYVGMILNSGDLLLSTINDVLDYSKIESGRIDIETASFDVIDLVEGLIDAITPMVRQKGTDLVFFPSRNLPRHLIGDAVRIRQVLLNLVSNAIKFTESGYVEIGISMEEDGQIRFQVEDTGIGIPADRMAEIFLPFVQAESSTTREFGGTGLGLSISHRLVSLMGGELDAASTLGHGTCFFFQLPLAVAETGSPATTWGEESSLEGKQILLLEDVAINQKLLVHTFEAANASVTLVGDWPEFLNRDFASAKFDLVVLDRFLGKEDLSSHLKTIQETCGDSPKFLMLASDTTGLLSGTCDGILQKPIKASQLLSQCRKLLAGQTSRVMSGSAKPANEPTEINTSLKILIVEDNRLNQIIARTMLNHLGIYDIHFANNGEEGVEAWRNLSPDMILMDCQMPKLDGYQATRAIRADEAAAGNGRRVPIVGLSAAAIQGDSEKALLAGMDDYLTKPLRPEELHAKIQKFSAGQLRR